MAGKLLAAAAVAFGAGLGIGCFVGPYFKNDYFVCTTVPHPPSEPIPAREAAVEACPAETGDCCEAMLAASRAQKIVAAQPKPEVEKPSAGAK